MVTLIQRFERPVFNLVSRLIDDPSDAADVAQEVFLKVLRSAETSRGESTPKAWIYKIAVNEVRNRRRWFRRHRRQKVDLDRGPGEPCGYEDSLGDRGEPPFQTMIDQETQALVEEALSKVNPKFRAALVLREIEGLSDEEISEILDVSLRRVRWRIMRGRDALRNRLAGLLHPPLAPDSNVAFDFGARLEKTPGPSRIDLQIR